MWKVKQSKYKNAFPKIPKREEWITEFNTNTLLSSCGNHIKSSLSHMIFNASSSGLTVLPIDVKGRQDVASVRHIFAHSDFVSDFDLSPCDAHLLATCSFDCTVKIWQLPDEITDDISNAIATFSGFEKRVENVVWHPCSSEILAVTSDKTVSIYDVTNSAAKFALPVHNDHIQSVSWKLDGSLLVTSCRDKLVRIIDPRSQAVSQEEASHPNVKDSRALWLGDLDYVLTSGFDSMRQREVCVRDVRMALKSVAKQTFDTSSGVLMPLFDADTNMLFLAGQGDTMLRYLEVSTKEPFLHVSSTDTVEQAKGIALVPKLACDVMSGEVNRVLLLTKNGVIPLPYIVPRKSYSDYHEELFPDTLAIESALAAAQWCSGDNAQRQRISLNPAKRGQKSTSPASPAAAAEPTDDSVPKAMSHGDYPGVKQEVSDDVAGSESPFSVKLRHVEEADKSAAADTRGAGTEPTVAVSEPPKAKTFAGVRQSKFRHLVGKPLHRSLHIDNIRNLSHTVPGESDMFAANRMFCAVPLSGSGGLIAIMKPQEPGRLPDTGNPMIQNGSHVTDFVFDPFDHQRLVVGCDDAKIRVWDLPRDVSGTLTEPTQCLSGHNEKLYLVRFHPHAKDLLTSASYDMTVRIWNVQTATCHITLEGHTDTIFSLAWSADGMKCATVCKDGKLRVYEPRTSSTPVQEGQGPAGTRGARVVWVLDDSFLAVTGFDRTSTRIVSIYRSDDVSKPAYTLSLDVKPAIVIPHYDADSSSLFLTGRGDSTVHAFEVTDEYPHLYQLADFSASTPHQALVFLPKNEVDVKIVEFAKAFRLTSNSIEPVSFTVPRVKMDYFQDDVFPDTRVTWSATLSADEWLSGKDVQQPRVSLKPAEMTSLSDKPTEAPKPKKYEDFHQYQKTYKTDDEKRDELVSAITNKLGVQDAPLPQELNEGVDSDEWED